jgi:YVTN family beta-propeller protein
MYPVTLFHEEKIIMKINRTRVVSIAVLILLLVVTYGSLKADTSSCGGASITLPFTDVGTSFAFCFIAEAYFSGLTSGTSATTFGPSNTVTREQMAVFITRAQDAALRRGSRRAALNQFWTTAPHFDLGLATTTLGSSPQFVASDGADLWVTGGDAVSRVRASDGKMLETWTGASSAAGVLSAMGRVFVTGQVIPGNLYMIDPSQPAGAVTTVSSNLGDVPQGIAFDGNRIWTANLGNSISIITPGASLPWGVVTVSTGFITPEGILYDGTNIWVSERDANTLLKLDSSANILQTVTLGTVGTAPGFPIFDGTNIWVPNGGSNTVSVIRASTGTVLATLSGNGLNGPASAAFDGQRILVTNAAGSVSLWKAADLTALGTFSTGASSAPFGACSDGLNFWITQQGTSRLARF